MIYRQQNSGQIMLLSIMILAGVMLSASLIAGLLVRHQIRQVNDAVSSAKAIFAADTGIEFISWCIFEGCSEIPDPFTSIPPHDCAPGGDPSLITVSFDDTSTCFELVPADVTSNTLTLNARGFSGRTLRILEAVFASE